MGECDRPTKAAKAGFQHIPLGWSQIWVAFSAVALDGVHRYAELLEDWHWMVLTGTQNCSRTGTGWCSQARRTARGLVLDGAHRYAELLEDWYWMVLTGTPS
jgi:hypothetical protein